VDTPAAHALALGARGIVEFNTGYWRPAIDSCAKADVLFRERCAGFVWESTTAQMFCLFAQIMLGDLGAACGRMPEALKEAAERGDLYSATNLRTIMGYLCFLLRDNPAGARADLEDAMARWPAGVGALQTFNSSISHLYIDLYGRKPEQALARIDGLWKGFERAMLLRVQTLRVSALGVRSRALITLTEDKPDRELTERARRDARALEREKVPYAVGQGELTHAALAHQAGDAAGAMAWIDRAEASFREADMAMYVAAARRLRGILLGGDEGAALIKEAQEVGEAQGLKNWLRYFETMAPGFD
jgi:hypothetical protein